MASSIYKLYGLFQPGFRRARLKLFLDRLQPGPATQILDVGGYVYDWEGVVPIDSPVTFLNLSHPPRKEPLPARYTCLVGDARHLPFADKSFDVAFSNSVIEHVGDYEEQRRFAAEVSRVGRQLFVQTPNRWFFIEPHFGTIFIHFLPSPLARFLLRFLSFRGLFRQGDNVDLEQATAELRLLTCKELRALFPGCEIYREKWLGMTKSFIVIRSEAAPGPGLPRPA